MPVRDAMGRTALVLSALRGSVEGIAQCLESHPNPQNAVNEADKHDVTALECTSVHSCCLIKTCIDLCEGSGTSPLTQFVKHVKPKPKLDTRDTFNLDPSTLTIRVAVMDADTCWRGHVKAADYLLRKGADPTK